MRKTLRAKKHTLEEAITAIDIEDSLTGRPIGAMRLRPHQSYYDATVYSMLSQGRTFEEIIGVLFLEKQKLMKRTIELELLTPKKFRFPDGSVQIWQCPADLIPETRLEPL